jgi:hypothetical protein
VLPNILLMGNAAVLPFQRPHSLGLSVSKALLPHYVWCYWPVCCCWIRL